MTNTIRVTAANHIETADCQNYSVISDLIYAGDSRLDATNYAEASSQALSAILATKTLHSDLGNLCGSIWHPVQNQARSNFKRIYVDPQHGVPYVGSREMFFFPLRPEKYLSRRIPKLQDLMVPAGWLLVSRSGTVGNVLYVYDRLSKCAITDHAIRIEPIKVPSGYLYAFLASKYGQPLVSQSTYGSTVDELEPKHLASIPVPLFNSSDRNEIHENILCAFKIRDEANILLDKAEATLYSALDLKPFTSDDIEYLGDPSEVKAFDIDSSELGTRFDATNHVPVVRSVLHKLKRARYSLVSLGAVCSNINIPPRFKRIYVTPEHGTPFLQSSHINMMMKPYNLKYLSNKAHKDLSKWIIRDGWILVSCSGTIGRVTLTTGRLDGWAASQHIERIVPTPNKLDPGYLVAFLGTPYGQHQLTSKIYGGIVDELTEADTKSLVLPNPPLPIQMKIGDLVLKAFEKRDQAVDIEARTIQQVERLIDGKN